jgi:nucleotide-binding universal stress UspA family protein
MKFRRILCPVDFSKASSAALRTAAELTRASGGRLTVLFVGDPLLVAAAAAAHDPRVSAHRSAIELDRFVRRALRSAPKPRGLRTIIAVGQPAREILKLARQPGADLIVMGTRGMGGIMRLLLGSTAEAVLRNSRTPVLAVPLATRTLTTLERAISHAQARRDRLEIKAVERVMKAMRLPARSRTLRH